MRSCHSLNHTGDHGSNAMSRGEGTVDVRSTLFFPPGGEGGCGRHWNLVCLARPTRVKINSVNIYTVKLPWRFLKCGNSGIVAVSAYGTRACFTTLKLS